MDALLLLFKVFAWTHPAWTAAILGVCFITPVWCYTRWMERTALKRDEDHQPNPLLWLLAVVLTAIAFVSAILQIFLLNNFIPTVQECRTVYGTQVITKSTVVVFDEDPLVNLDREDERVYTNKVKVTMCRPRLEFHGEVWGEWEVGNALVIHESGSTRSL